MKPPLKDTLVIFGIAILSFTVMMSVYFMIARREVRERVMIAYRTQIEMDEKRLFNGLSDDNGK